MTYISQSENINFESSAMLFIQLFVRLTDEGENERMCYIEIHPETTLNLFFSMTRFNSACQTLFIPCIFMILCIFSEGFIPLPSHQARQLAGKALAGILFSVLKGIFICQIAANNTSV